MHFPFVKILQTKHLRETNIRIRFGTINYNGLEAYQVYCDGQPPKYSPIKRIAHFQINRYPQNVKDIYDKLNNYTDFKLMVANHTLIYDWS